MSFYALSALTNAIVSTFVGIFVFSRDRRDPRYLTHSFFSTTVAIWSYFYFLWQITPDKNVALFACRGLMAGAIFIPVCYLHHLTTLLNIYNQKKKLIISGYIGGLVFLALDITPLFVRSVSPKMVFKFWPNAGPVFFPFLILWIGYVLYGVDILIKQYRKSYGAYKNQIKYVILATFIGWSGGATNYPLWFNIPLLPFGNILVSGYMIILTYAILRYRLMDINVALTRAGIFAIVYTLVLGGPLYLGYRYGLWQYSTWAMLFLATLGPFIYNYLRRRAEDVILKGQRRYQHALRELSKTMTRIRDLDELLKTVTSTIKDMVKVSYCAIYIKEEQYSSCRLKSNYSNGSEVKLEEFIKLDSKLIKLIYSKKMPLLGEEAKSEEGIPFEFGLITPYFMEDELLGFLILGSKPNNQMYTPDDVLVFETLSYSTSLAIENSTFWKDIEDRQRKARLQEMDTYSYSLAHEIDNPMQVVLGQAGLLKKEVTDNVVDEEKRKEIIGSFDFILEAAKRVSGMVKAIRDFGQKTTGEFKALNIEDVVESFIKLYYPQFKDNTVFFEKVNNLKEPVFVRGEKPELMQVLVILANNSIHAMTGLKEKKAVLTLSLSNHELVKISFSDNGYGIKKENLEIIFTPFTTTKASTEGTGMGLYNAKKIIDRHKGKIRAESEGAGKGATFFIELPIARDITEEELNKENKSSKRLI